MYIDSATIITIASVIGALSAIGAVAYKAIKWFQTQEQQTKNCHNNVHWKYEKWNSEFM